MKNENGIQVGMLNFTAALVSLCLIVYILSIGYSILMPLVAAIVIWYLMIRLSSWFSRMPIVGAKLPKMLAMILAIIMTTAIMSLFVNLISSSIYGIIDQAPQYQQKINQMVLWVNDLFGAHFEINQMVSGLNFSQIFSNVALTLTNVASNLGIIIVYVIFLLLEYETFDAKIKAMTRSKKTLDTSRAIIDQIAFDINSYMKIKAGVSLLTGGLSYILLFSFGVSYAQFWAVLIFILNFIPTIGSIIAVAITLIAVSVHFNSLTMFIVLGVLLTLIQLVVGNFVEPRLMGRNLNLSPLAILLSLAFWGSIWGVLGMFLCVPLMTIINIILSKFEATHFIAVLFSADPEVIKR